MVRGQSPSVYLGMQCREDNAFQGNSLFLVAYCASISISLDKSSLVHGNLKDVANAVTKNMFKIFHDLG